MVYSHPVSALPDCTCRVAICVALDMGNTAGIDENMIDAGGWENIPMDFGETAQEGQVDPSHEVVSISTSLISPKSTFPGNYLTCTIQSDIRPLPTQETITTPHFLQEGEGKHASFHIAGTNSHFFFGIHATQVQSW